MSAGIRSDNVDVPVARNGGRPGRAFIFVKSLTFVGFGVTVFRNGLALVVWVKGRLRFCVKRRFHPLAVMLTSKATCPLPSESLAALEAEL